MHRSSFTRPPAAPAPRLVAQVVLALLLAVSSIGPQEASARRGGDRDREVRVAGTCGKGAKSKLRLRARDGRIRVNFEVDHNRSRALWRVVLVHERRVVWRGRARTRGASDSFEIERRLRDLPGADRVTARASGPRGLTCAASATLRG